MKKTILIFLSGGVDSLITAFILKKRNSYVIKLLYFRTWVLEGSEFTKCLWKGDICLVKKAALKLKDNLHILNSIKKYKGSVVSYLLNYYKGCLTPNADIRCNSSVKFNYILNWSLNNFNQIIATGHYITIFKTRLGLAKDFIKDQTFFLSSIGKSKLLFKFFKFPLGRISKKTVEYLSINKKFTKQLKFISSRGLCFFKNITFKDFLYKYLGKVSFLMLYFTLGQKLNLNYSSNNSRGCFRILKKNIIKGRMFVSCKPPLFFRKSFYVYLLSTGLRICLKLGTFFLCKINHGIFLYKVRVYRFTKQTAYVCFVERGVCVVPGQPIVFYTKKNLIGSGTTC